MIEEIDCTISPELQSIIDLEKSLRGFLKTALL